jgi:hypothetical protein
MKIKQANDFLPWGYPYKSSNQAILLFKIRLSKGKNTGVVIQTAVKSVFLFGKFKCKWLCRRVWVSLAFEYADHVQPRAGRRDVITIEKRENHEKTIEIPCWGIVKIVRQYEI